MSSASYLAVQDSDHLPDPLETLKNHEKSNENLEKNTLSSGLELTETDDFYLLAVQEVSLQLLRKIFKNFSLSLEKDQEEPLRSSDLTLDSIERHSVQETEFGGLSVDRTEMLKNSEIRKDDFFPTAETCTQQDSLSEIKSQNERTPIIELQLNKTAENSSADVSYLIESEGFIVKSKKIGEIFKSCKEILSNETSVVPCSDPRHLNIFQKSQIDTAETNENTEACSASSRKPQQLLQNIDSSMNNDLNIFQVTENTSSKLFLIDSTSCETLIFSEKTMKKNFKVDSKASFEPLVITEKTIKKSFHVDSKARHDPLVITEKTIKKSFHVDFKARHEPQVITEKTIKKIFHVDFKARHEPQVITEKTTKKSFQIESKFRFEPLSITEKTKKQNFSIQVKKITESLIINEKTIKQSFTPMKKHKCEILMVVESSTNKSFDVHFKPPVELILIVDKKPAGTFCECFKEPRNGITLKGSSTAARVQDIESIQKSILNEGESANLTQNPFSDPSVKNSVKTSNLSTKKNPETSNPQFLKDSVSGNSQISEVLKSSLNHSNDSLTKLRDPQLIKSKLDSKALNSGSLDSSGSSNDNLSENHSIPVIQNDFLAKQQKVIEAEVKTFSGFLDVQPVQSIIIEKPENWSEYQSQNIANQYENILHKSIFESEFEFKSSSMLSSTDSNNCDAIPESFKLSSSDFILIPSDKQEFPASLKENFNNYEELKSDSEDDFELI